MSDTFLKFYEFSPIKKLKPQKLHHTKRQKN